eukprot:scaffold26767_cov153-Skeletonema_menzelii.AAC.2
MATCSSSGPARRGKVFLTAPAVKKQHVVATADPSSPSSVIVGRNNCQVDDEATAPTVEDFANLFFGSDDDDHDSCNSLTGNSSIQSLAMKQHQQHHHWEPVPLPLLPSAHRHKRRRVSFTTETPTIHTLHTVPPSSTMTPHEKSASWLQCSDIETLKASAQSTIQAVRNRVSSKPREFKHRHKFRKLMVAIENEFDASIRGLEHKVYRRKETRKTLIQDVIECQRHINGLARFGHVMSMEEKRRLLAKASLQKSEMCVQRALLDANDDYKEVYSSNNGGQKKYDRSISGLPCPLGAAAFKIRRVSSGATVTEDDGGAKLEESL